MEVATAPSSSGEQQLSNVMYIGRFPHGFYEDQMRAFFTQFGEIINLRISRNKKTGASKHYAYIQFATPEVASIVAGAMDGYMLLKQKLRCNVLRKAEVHPELWKGANRKFRTMPRQKLEMQKHNKPRTPEQAEKRLQRALQRDQQRARALQEAGIDYTYQPLAEVAAADTAVAPGANQPVRHIGGCVAAAAPSGKKRKAAAAVEAAVKVKAARAKGRLADLQHEAARREDQGNVAVVAASNVQLTGSAINTRLVQKDKNVTKAQKRVAAAPHAVQAAAAVAKAGGKAGKGPAGSAAAKHGKAGSKQVKASAKPAAAGKRAPNDVPNVATQHKKQKAKVT